MKRILGLDVGTNSIGAAVITLPDTLEDFGSKGSIEWMGSRIVPVDTKYLNEWEKGGSALTKAAERRLKRGSRRLKQRYKLRRSRLISVMKLLNWVSNDFPTNFKKESEIVKDFKISEYMPISEDSIKEAATLLGGNCTEDWLVYYLRKKGLTQKLTFAELGRILYMFNQRRGFKSSRKDLKEATTEEVKCVKNIKIQSIEQISDEPNKLGKHKFRIYPYTLANLPEGCELNFWEVDLVKKPEWEDKEDNYILVWKKNPKTGKFEMKENPKAPKVDDWELTTEMLKEQMGDKHPGEFFFDKLVESKQNFKIRQYAVYRSKYKAELEAIWKKQCELNPELLELNNDTGVLTKIAHLLYPTESKIKGNKIREFTNLEKLNEKGEKTIAGLIHVFSNDIIYYQRPLKSQRKSLSECQYEKTFDDQGNSYGVKVTNRSNPYFQEFRIWQEIHNLKIFKNEAPKTIKDRKTGEPKTIISRDVDVTNNYISNQVKEKLFELLNVSNEVSLENVIKVINDGVSESDKINSKDYRINHFFKDDKKLQGNVFKYNLNKIFQKYSFGKEAEEILNNEDKIFKLWSILYSIESSDIENTKEPILLAISNNKNRRKKDKSIVFDFPPEVAEAIATSKSFVFEKTYSSYSTKALKKLLPAMRVGKYWNEQKIHLTISNTLESIKERAKAKLSTDENIEVTDDEVTSAMMKSLRGISRAEGLSTHQACYLAYSRHSEKSSSKKYESYFEFEKEILKILPNNSLNNPVVEGIVRETLFVVRDVWKQFGQIDEIHIELARDLKNNAKQREAISNKNKENEDERILIKKMLNELLNGFEEKDESDNTQYVHFSTPPNPNNPFDIRKFSIWQSQSGKSMKSIQRELNISKNPSATEIRRMALWLSQKCRSLYTGRLIPLSKLFTIEYEIEHVLPRSLIKNDSMNNLVIAETSVNKAKGNELSAIFIKESNGSCQYNGRAISLLDFKEYEDLCNSLFPGQNNPKRKNLLAEEIPQGFIERQINDTRYINRKLSELLFPVVKNSIVFTGGVITNDLKKQWGMNAIWKKLLLDRFRRVEKMTGKKLVFENNNDRNDFSFSIKELQDDVSKPDIEIKRLDHRHHALDALIIACTTIEHIRYLNTLSAMDDDKKQEHILISKYIMQGDKKREFRLPWDSFVHDAKNALEETMVTFKVKKDVISKPQNKYEKYLEKEGKFVKDKNIPQATSPKWFAVRTDLFNEPQGMILVKEVTPKPLTQDSHWLEMLELQRKRMKVQNTLNQKTAPYIYDQSIRTAVIEIIKLFPMIENADKKQIKIQEKQIIAYLKTNPIVDEFGEVIKEYRIALLVKKAAKRVSIDGSFDRTKINKIPYGNKKASIGKNKTLPEILHEHLELYGDPKKAFIGEGLDELDKKTSFKIRKVTICEAKSNPIILGSKVYESKSNAFFYFYEDEITIERSGFDSMTAFEVIRRKKEGIPLFEQIEGAKLHIYQAGDIVYAPTPEEREKIKQGIPIEQAIPWEKRKHLLRRLYKIVKFSGGEVYLCPILLSKGITEKEINNTQGLMTQRIIDFDDINGDSEMIKKCSLKVDLNRIGNTIKPYL